MHKINYVIIMLFIFSHCSIDTKSGLWENKNIMNNDKKLSEIDFNKKLTFFEFKENVILYSKKSKFPVITK
tara:strand:+ start:689 stop:901 length:213 start_codon:yes stop_codon:yes gene_type:complete